MLIPLKKKYRTGSTCPQHASKGSGNGTKKAKSMAACLNDSAKGRRSSSTKK